MSVINDLIDGLTVEFSRLTARVADLFDEMDPRTTVEMLPGWERNWGLPDPCTQPPLVTVPERQAALTARVTARGAGGSNVAKLIAIAVELGYTDAFIRRFHLPAFTCTSQCDDPLNTLETGWGFVYEIVLPHNAEQTTAEATKCEIDRTAMAHLAVGYAFPLFLSDDADLTHVRSGTANMIAPETQDETALADGILGTIYYGQHEDGP